MSGGIWVGDGDVGRAGGLGGRSTLSVLFIRRYPGIFAFSFLSLVEVVNLPPAVLQPSPIQIQTQPPFNPPPNYPHVLLPTPPERSSEPLRSKSSADIHVNFSSHCLYLVGRLAKVLLLSLSLSLSMNTEVSRGISFNLCLLMEFFTITNQSKC